MVYDPSLHHIKPILIAPSIQLVGASKLVHKLVNFKEFDYFKTRQIMGNNGGIIILYEKDKVIHPMRIVGVQKDEFVLVFKYESDWTTNLN